MQASAGMAGTMGVAWLVVVGSIDGKQWYTSTQQRQKTSLQLCAAVRKLPREKLVMLYNIFHLLAMVVFDEAHPEHDSQRSGSWDAVATDTSAER